MNRNRMLPLLAGLLLRVLFATGHKVFAFPVQSLDNFPQSGMLAAAGTLQPSTLNLPLPLGLAPGVTAPITGSVSSGPKGAWSCSVSNNSRQTLQVRTSAVEYVKGPKRGGSRTFSYKLKPGQSASDPLPGRADTIGYILNLEGWKIIEKRP